MLVKLLASPSDAVQRQASKALANLGVNCASPYPDFAVPDEHVAPILRHRTPFWLFFPSLPACRPVSVSVSVSASHSLPVENKVLIAKAGGIPPLVHLADVGGVPVQIEAVAALANLAVNGARTHSSQLRSWS